MANVYGYQFGYSKEAQVWKLYAVVTIGASGAPTLVAAQSKGVASVARTGAGKYTITLSDVWNRLLNIDITQKLASGALASPDMNVVSEAVATYGTQTIAIQFASAGTATDPSNGTSLLVEITLKNSSV